MPFNEEHFRLLRDWAGQYYDRNNDEHREVYRILWEAYDVTKQWAERLQQEHFPGGSTRTIRRPVDRGGTFRAYNWARIYPSQNSPRGLAYTVGINKDHGFIVKIDLVDTAVSAPNLRTAYEQICGDFTASPIVAIKPIAEGLSQGIDALVNWSAEAIPRFSPSYDEVAQILGLYSHDVPKSADEDRKASLARSQVRNEVPDQRNKTARNVIYYGPPGTGKTFNLQDLLASHYTDGNFGKRYRFVTFHQSYGYEEFVEGLRPVIAKAGEIDTVIGSAINGEVRYEIKRGVFRELCEEARKNPSQRYAMVIDEINRGNISKIFGELITLLEVDKREGAKFPIFVTLPYSGESFSVPSNVDVIGTMNTADRSLALVDTALRRRFEFEERMPNPSILADIVVSHNGVDVNIEMVLTMLNRRIEALYDRDHTLGHAFFTHIKDLEDSERFNELKSVFKRKIIPLLEEYFFEDWQKIRLVLGDNQKFDRELQFVHEISGEEDLFALFGNRHELDQYSARYRYQLNSAALDQPFAYVGIYSAAPPVINE